MSQLKIIFMVLVIFISGCSGKIEQEKANEAIPVRVVKVEMRSLEEALDYSGSIKAQDEAVVYPKVSGKVIEKIKEEGSQVEKGEVILYLDRDEVG
ncbi:MAG: hypothetical protein AB1481_01855, partial [Candidatus Omnitrophota bacterium]